MKNVLVTGGSGAIGSAICKELASLGFFVGVHYNKNREKAEALAKEIGGIAVGFDIKDAEQVKNGVEYFVKKAGGICALINNAGIAQTIKPLLDTSEQEFDEVFSVNIKGVFLASKAVIPHMLEKGGNIVNISSMWGLVGASCESVYSASKGAVNSFTKALAKEYASAKIKVNAIAGGFIDTPMNAILSDDDKNLCLGDIPLGRFGRPEDVAKLVAYLCSENCFMTGEVINLSGGEVII